MAITKTDVLLVAPELTSVTDAQWAAFIGFAYLQLSASAWGDWLDMAATYLVAHTATLSKRGGSGGQVTSESVGQVSRSYAAAAAASVYSATAYGAEFERLARMVTGARLPVIG